MRKTSAGFFTILLTFTLLCSEFFSAAVIPSSGFPAAVYAEETLQEPLADASAAVQEAGDATGISFLPGYDRVRMKYISFPFLDTATVAYDWKFPYSDHFFRHPSDQFSVLLARGSLGMALSAFRSTTGVVEPQYTAYLKGAGFKSLYAFGYNKPTTQDSLSGVIGMKQIDDFTVIAAVTCGQGYQNEWAGNFIVGEGVRHQGFDAAADLLEKHINDYILVHKIKGKKKIWLNGMSRAGAVANVAAADFIESGEYEDVYAYLYGVPRTTKEPVAYPGIFNICGQYDPVASIPLQSWGYERYGTDLYTPSQEADSGYAAFSRKAGMVSRDLTDKDFRNNPEINYQLRLIIEFLGDFFPAETDYTDRFQQYLLEAMQNKKNADITAILTESMSRIDTISQQEKTSKNVFIEYLSYIAAEHLRATQRQIDTGVWATDEPLAANLVLEHRPSTYVKWLFSDIEPEKLFQSPISTRKLTFIGNVGARVFRDGVNIGSISSSGKLSYPSADEGAKGSAPVLFMMRNGEQTVINLPAVEEYMIEITADKASDLTYYDQIVSSAVLKETAGRIQVGNIGEGTATLTVSPFVPIGPLDNGTASYSSLVDADFECSPTVIMSNELEATKHSHITIGRVVRILLRVQQLILVTLLICLIVSAVHRRKVKKGHDPYSDLYVIIPHVLFILIFMGLTQYVTYFLFTIGKLRSVNATIAISIIFILALRGLIRYPSKRNAAVTLVLLTLIPLTYMYYLRLPIGSFSVLNMIIYFAVNILLTAAAVRSFRRIIVRKKAAPPESALP